MKLNKNLQVIFFIILVSVYQSAIQNGLVDELWDASDI